MTRDETRVVITFESEEALDDTLRWCGSASARSVIVVLDGDGAELWTHRIDNDPLRLGLEIEAAGPEPEVVLEATWGGIGRRM